MDRSSFLKRTAVVVMGIRAFDGKAVEEAFVDIVRYDDPAVHIKLHSTVLEVDEILRQMYLPVMVDVMNRDTVLLSGMAHHIDDHRIRIEWLDA